MLSYVFVEGLREGLCEGLREAGGMRLETSSRFLGSRKQITGPHFTGACVNNRGVRFHRIRGFNNYDTETNYYSKKSLNDNNNNNYNFYNDTVFRQPLSLTPAES